MRITQVQIRSVLGVAERKLECGSLTRIKGRNGSSKTSILEAIKASLGGGNLARIARVGAEEEPETVLVLDDGAYRVERRGDKTKVKARVGDTAAYEDVSRPQTFLDGLFDPKLSNPVRFLTAKPDERAELLLEALPLNLDRAALWEALGDEAAAAVGALVKVQGHPLEVLARVREAIFDERTGVNRSAKDKESSAYELAKTLPAEVAADPAAGIAALEERRNGLLQEIAATRAEADAAASKIRTEADAAYDVIAERLSGTFKAEAAKVRLKLEQDIATLRAATEAQIAGLKATGEAELGAADQARERGHERADEELAARLGGVDGKQVAAERLTTEIATRRGLAERAIADKKTRELVDRFENDASNLKALADRLTAAIATVDAFKRKLADELPMGLEIDGKAITVKGVPWDQVNTAMRIRIAVHVAGLRAKTQKLKVVFVDGAEALDAEQMKLLEQELKAADLQSFLAVVDDCDLTVEAIA